VSFLLMEVGRAGDMRGGSTIPIRQNSGTYLPRPIDQSNGTGLSAAYGELGR